MSAPLTRIAQIVVDWSIDGTGPDGKHVHVEGTASDVARRGTDGRWRYLIDNRLGTAMRHLRANLQAATLALPSDTLAKLEALGTKSEQKPKEDI